MYYKVSKTIYYIILAAIGLLALSLFIPLLPIPGNYQVKVVLSGSMEPAIKTGSVIFFKPSNQYKVGDIVTFNIGDNTLPITHRIAEVKNERGFSVYTTKGDANEAPDQNILKESQILGKVFLTLPYLGYAIETARQPYGFLALIIIPALIIIWDQCSKIWNEIVGIKRNKDYENSN